MKLPKQIKKLDAFVRRQPQFNAGLGLVVLLIILLYLDYVTGPDIPFTLFYFSVIYLSLIYVERRFSYLLAFLTPLMKTHLGLLQVADDLHVATILWRFFSAVVMYQVFCYLMDAQISRRKSAEIALHSLSELNQSIITNTDAGIMVFKESGSCSMANPAAARIVGAPLARLLAFNFRRDEGGYEPDWFTAAEQALTTGKTQKLEFPVRNLRGEEIWCIAAVSRIMRQHGEPYLLVVFEDVSAYKEALRSLVVAHRTAEAALNRAGEAERRIISISEETQQRIGQELHDDLGQHLTGVAFMSEVLAQKLKNNDKIDQREMAKITALVNEAISKTRQLAHGLYPVELKESGLEAMLNKFAENVRSVYGIECEFVAGQAVIAQESFEEGVHLFRIAQEAVNNAIRHGNASRIRLTLNADAGGRTMEIEDNGSGIQADTAGRKSGIGMYTMQYRAALIGADLSVQSPHAGGTRITVHLPVQYAHERQVA
jgi:PAS domain S-box-containing protein